MTLPLALGWSAATTPPAIATALRALAEEYPLREGAAGDLAITFAPGAADTVVVSRQGRQATIAAGTTALALRGVGSLLSGVVAEGATLTERAPFTTFGIMLDCSRNAVMTVPQLRRWWRRLALLGYNLAMLYTEDTYQLPGEPWFGYLRGAYSADDLRALDDYAASLGLELIGCIQTLGHLQQILKWHAYREVADTSSVLLVDEDQTYALIEKMLAHFASVCRSRRIQIGMDETHDLGRGRFMDRHGYERGFDIFNRHLARVTAMCRQHGLQPMIWSDMYFRMGSKTGEYYDRACQIPPDVAAAIPREAQLVYWDYYHEEREFYLDWIARHRALGHEPLMGGGLWTWHRLWYDHAYTVARTVPCLEACREAGVREFFFTMWGDDGGYCEPHAVLCGLAWAADLAYGGRVDDAAFAARGRAILGADLPASLLAARLHEINNPVAILWDDPLLAMYLQHERARQTDALASAAACFAGLALQLQPHLAEAGAGRIRHAELLCRTLAAKLRVGDALIGAYAAGDKTRLTLLRADVMAVRDLYLELAESWRAGWLAAHQPFGLEVMQIRLAGLAARYAELDRRLKEFAAGTVATIPELDAHLPAPPPGYLAIRYSRLATGSCIL
jgi:hypothetical protein